MDWAGVGGKYFTMLVKPSSPSDMLGKIKVSTKSENEDGCQIFIPRKPVLDETSNDTYYIYVGPRQERELIKYNDQTKMHGIFQMRNLTKHCRQLDSFLGLK